MIPLDSPTPAPWYHGSRFRLTAMVVLAVVLLAKSIVAIFFRDNDFLCHRFVGELFLRGEPYQNGYFIMYPLGRVMMNGLLALGPLYITRAVCFSLALLALYGSFRIWRRLTDSMCPAVDRTNLAAGVFTVVLLLAYVMRDLDECGLQLFLLFFLSAAVSSLAQGRNAWAGFWLATAATYKVTPLLALPYLLWKRQWRAVGWTTAFLGLWAIAPTPFLGWEKTVESQGRWVMHVRAVMANRQAYPDQLVEPQRTDNLSLIALLARNLETYSPGHELHVDHPLFFQPGNLAPENAYFVVRAILLGIGLALAWRFRHPGTGDVGSNGMIVEWSAVCLLCAIVSPVCWKQHMVLALPAVFIAVRATLAQPTRGRILGLILFGMATNLGRAFLLGRDLSTLYHAYKMDTIALLAMLVFVLTLPAMTAARTTSLVPRAPTRPKALAA